jgi:hypothetical protein
MKRAASKLTEKPRRQMHLSLTTQSGVKRTLRGRRENDVDETQLGHPALKQHADD